MREEVSSLIRSLQGPLEDNTTLCELSVCSSHLTQDRSLEFRALREGRQLYELLGTDFKSSKSIL
jgi:hypothetical protein